MNDSIPVYNSESQSFFEYFLTDPSNSLSIDQSKYLTDFEIESGTSLFNFQTINSIIQDPNNSARIAAKL